MNRATSVTNLRIADRLVTDERITAEQRQRAVDYVSRHGGRIEDALIELDIIGETGLLKFIATLHETRFVSTEKLYKAKIDPRMVAVIPLKVAELHGVFPVLYDDKRKALSIVTADPDNEVAKHDVRLAAGVKHVVALMARPAAVYAAIARGYRGDPSAFAQLMKVQAGYIELMTNDPFQRQSEVNMQAYEDTGSNPDLDGESLQLAPSPEPATPPPAKVAATQQSPMPLAAAPSLGTLDVGTAAVAKLAPSEATAPPVRDKLASAVELQAHGSVVTSREYLETLNVLVSLLDNSRGELRGHSSMVARLVRKTCERIGLPDEQSKNITIAAYIHDLGKAGAYHLTPLNVAEYEGHKVAAQKVVEVPTRLLESVGLSPDTTLTVLNMYERMDGKGFPQGLSGKEIPLGARILAVVDTYADLTQNPRNPYRKALRPVEACDVLSEFRDSVFDANIVDLFRQAMTGDDLRAKLLANRHTILIVDPDPEETTVLELRLIEQGYDVKVARSAEQAERELSQGTIELVVSEIDLDVPDGGVTLRGAALREPWGRDLIWVVLTRKTDRQVAQIVFDLGVDDFVNKPAQPEILVAKLNKLVERKAASAAPRGVSGSLSEMGLPDMVQILWHGRKTCALKIKTKKANGEIHFSEGQIVNALWGAVKGENAFYSMMGLREGDFRLDPSFTPGEILIKASPEALLLEGMRRLDEGGLDPDG